MGRVDRKEGGWGGVDRKGEGEIGRGIWKRAMGRGAIGTGRGWQWGGGQSEEEMVTGAMGRGAMGKERWGEGNRDG